MPNAVIITGPGFQDQDVVYTYYRFKEARFEVDVATKRDPATGNGIHVSGRYGVPVPLDKTAGEPIAFDELAAEGAVSKYDLVVLTGGYEAPDRVRQERLVKDFVRAMDDAGKVVAGLCHGPWIMISAGIMRGRRACAYIGLRDDMIHAGADVIDAQIVTDDNIVTCSYYGEVGAFMSTVLGLVEDRAGVRVRTSQRVPTTQTRTSPVTTTAHGRRDAPRRRAGVRRRLVTDIGPKALAYCGSGLSAARRSGPPLITMRRMADATRAWVSGARRGSLTEALRRLD